MKCRCCGEYRLSKLELDHILNDGKQHRKKVGTANMYLWSKMNGYPKGLQTLCRMCHLSKTGNIGRFCFHHPRIRLDVPAT